MNDTAKAIIAFIGDHVLTEHASEDIQTIVGRLPEHTEEAAATFCEILELGNWFYEALILNDIDISTELIDIGTRKEKEEREGSAERISQLKDYQQMQMAN